MILSLVQFYLNLFFSEHKSHFWSCFYSNDILIRPFFFVFQQPGQQILTAAQCVQATNGGPSISGAPQQKRSAIADPTTGIPMAAYPVTTFPYASPSPLQIPFQGQYFTAVPMTCKFLKEINVRSNILAVSRSIWTFCFSLCRG